MVDFILLWLIYIVINSVEFVSSKDRLIHNYCCFICIGTLEIYLGGVLYILLKVTYYC